MGVYRSGCADYFGSSSRIGCLLVRLCLSIALAVWAVTLEFLLTNIEFLDVLGGAVSTTSAERRADLLRNLQGESVRQLLADAVSPEYVALLSSAEGQAR